MLPQFVYVVTLIAAVLSIHKERCHDGSNQRDPEQGVEVFIKVDRHGPSVDRGAR